MTTLGVLAGIRSAPVSSCTEYCHAKVWPRGVECAGRSGAWMCGSAPWGRRPPPRPSGSSRRRKGPVIPSAGAAGARCGVLFSRLVVVERGGTPPTTRSPLAKQAGEDKTDPVSKTSCPFYLSQYLANIYSKPSGTRKIRYSSVVKPPNNLTPVRARPTPLWRRSAPCHRPCAFVSRGDQNLRRGKHHTYSDERQQTHTHGPHTRKYEPKQGG